MFVYSYVPMIAGISIPASPSGQQLPTAAPTLASAACSAGPCVPPDLVGRGPPRPSAPRRPACGSERHSPCARRPRPSSRIQLVVEEEWAAMLRRLEDAGLAVEPVEAGRDEFSTEAFSAGPVASAPSPAALSMPPGSDGNPRPGAARRCFAALAQPPSSRPCRAVVVDDGEEALSPSRSPSISCASTITTRCR